MRHHIAVLARCCGYRRPTGRSPRSARVQFLSAIGSAPAAGPRPAGSAALSSAIAPGTIGESSAPPPRPQRTGGDREARRRSGSGGQPHSVQIPGVHRHRRPRPQGGSRPAPGPREGGEAHRGAIAASSPALGHGSPCRRADSQLDHWPLLGEARSVLLQPSLRRPPLALPAPPPCPGDQKGIAVNRLHQLFDASALSPS
jgi:hypothetical protein